MNSYSLIHQDQITLCTAKNLASYRFGADTPSTNRHDLFSKALLVLKNLPYNKSDGIVVLLDHPWVEIQLVELAYVPKPKAIRSILAHVLAKSFLNDLSEYNFHYYPQKRGTGVVLVVYAALKEISEQLTHLFSSQGWPFWGIYPFPHFQIYSELQKQNPSSNLWLAKQLPWLTRLLGIRDGVLVDYAKLDFAEDEAILNRQKAVRAKLQLMQFSQPMPLEVYFSPAMEGTTQDRVEDTAANHSEKDKTSNSFLIKKDPALEQLKPDYSELEQIFSLLAKKNLLCNLHRVENALLKELYRYATELKQVGIGLGASLAILLLSFGFRFWQNESEHRALMAVAQAQMKTFSPGETDFDSAKAKLQRELSNEEKAWERHQIFLAKTFSTSEFLLSLDQILSGAPSVKISGLVWDKGAPQISGTADSSADLDVFLKGFQTLLASKELSTQQSVISGKIVFQSSAVF